MLGFSEEKFYTTIITESEGVCFDTIKTYKKDKIFNADKQPINEKAREYKWGREIKSKWQIYTDIDLQVNDIIVNDTTYIIEKKLDWKEYKIYAILKSDVEVVE